MRFPRSLGLLKADSWVTVRSSLCSSLSGSEPAPDEEFRVLDLYPVAKQKKAKAKKIIYHEPLPPREKRMQVRNDWPSVWPTAQTFRPSVVPLPLYQGYVQKKSPPGKYANAELMKIPNFLHLTPPAVKQQCAVLKKFCTQWPKELETDEICDNHFPVEVITSSYCHSAPTIRDERSRIVTLKVKLEKLNLDYHARDKMTKLAGEERFDNKSDCLVLVTDRCPLKKQNYEYAIYLLAALYRESQICEPWESEMMEEDQRDFFFQGSRHQKRIEEMADTLREIRKTQKGESDQVIPAEKIEKYGASLEKVINEGETKENVQSYKEAVSQILGLT